MSLKEIQEDCKTFKFQLEEILSKLNSLQQNNVANIIEAASAKIIKDICDKLDKCECIKTYINELKDVSKEKEIISYPMSGLTKYSYPNYNVGNEQLGSSKNPDSMEWPFGLSKK